MNLTYNGSSTPPTAAGSYTVVGTINNSNYTGRRTGTLVIAKATATGDAGQSEPDLHWFAAVGHSDNDPVRLDRELTYNGSSTAPTAAGSYTVVGHDQRYQLHGSAHRNAGHRQGTATVTLGNLNQTYTGSPLSATATTAPSGLTVN